MDQAGVLAQYHVAPCDDLEFEAALGAMAEAMAAEELISGGILAYAFYRVQGSSGGWVGFGHFSANALARHGQGPMVHAAGERMMMLQSQPVEIRILSPVVVPEVWKASSNASRRIAAVDDTRDVGVFYDFGVDPEREADLEAALQTTSEQYGREKVQLGLSTTCSLYRDIATPGRWAIIRHVANGRAFVDDGQDIVEQTLGHFISWSEPHRRVLLKPHLVLGGGDRAPI